MITWLFSDPHFGHKRIKKLCHLPDDCEIKILRQLTTKTQPGDVVICLGDVAFYDVEKWCQEIVEALPGRLLWLIKGNHDKKSNTWYLSHGWHMVCEGLELNAFGRYLWLTHRPDYSRIHHVINVHGHFHNSDHHPEDCFVRNFPESYRLVYLDKDLGPVKLEDVVNNRHTIYRKEAKS